MGSVGQSTVESSATKRPYDSTSLFKAKRSSTRNHPIPVLFQNMERQGENETSSPVSSSNLSSFKSAKVDFDDDMDEVSLGTSSPVKQSRIFDLAADNFAVEYAPTEYVFE